TAHAEASAAAFHNLALALERIGDLEGARAALEQALERGGSDDPRIHTSLGAVHLLLGDVAAANAALFEAEALSQPHPDAVWYHYAALAAAWQGDLAHSRSVLEDGIARHPRAAALHNNLSVLLDRSGDASHALQAAQRGASEDAQLPQVHKNVGDLYYRGGRYDDARQAFERAVQARPDMGGDVYLKLGNIHLRQRRTDDAIACWERALEIDPNNAIARKNLEAVAQTRAVAVS